MPTYAVKLLAAGLTAWLGWAALTITQTDSTQGLWFFALQETLFWSGVLLLGATLLAHVLAKHAAWSADQALRPEPEDQGVESWAPHEPGA
ncbi:MAG: hypothetical protein KY446_12500 [Proteobacteria bacterium]|nr:hypothetical protein [Pseudomonadota bacterium]